MFSITGQEVVNFDCVLSAALYPLKDSVIQYILAYFMIALFWY